MWDAPLSSLCWNRTCPRVSFLPVLAISLMMFPSFARAGGSPQQTGAVPLTQGIADLASQLAKSIPEGHAMTIAVTDFPQKGQVCRPRAVCGRAAEYAHVPATTMPLD